MSYSPSLGTSVSNTHNRTRHISPFSGMCAICTATCTGTCEIGLSATRGGEAVHPYMPDINQFASEKDYPLDFSHIAINGRVFGAEGCAEDSYAATFPKVDIRSTFGTGNSVPILAPILLPAIAKLNWQDYFGGAALAGIPVVIGEDVIAKDKGLVLENGKVKEAPLVADMVQAFRAYHRGYGDVILQANYDDEHLGLLEYAITKLGVTSVELKFGQASKGIQGYGKLGSLEDALKFHSKGYVVYPDPTDPKVVENYKNGCGRAFEKIGKLPMWNAEQLGYRVAELRRLGAQRVCFKTGPYDPQDIVRILKIASQAGVDLVTLDGAGGGTGNSPVKMMNEWGVHTVCLESAVYMILKGMKERGYVLPQIAMAGGFAMEDTIYKGLTLGAPYIGLIAVGRGAMAAAMAGKQIGDALRQGTVPKEYARFGNSVDEIFVDLRELKGLYGNRAAEISTGAVGVYSYINRLSTGLRQLMALNRKFTLNAISREDIYGLTPQVCDVTGLDTYQGRMLKELNRI